MVTATGRVHGGTETLTASEKKSLLSRLPPADAVAAIARDAPWASSVVGLKSTPGSRRRGPEGEALYSGAGSGAAAESAVLLLGEGGVVVLRAVMAVRTDGRESLSPAVVTSEDGDYYLDEREYAVYDVDEVRGLGYDFTGASPSFDRELVRRFLRPRGP